MGIDMKLCPVLLSFKWYFPKAKASTAVSATRYASDLMLQGFESYIAQNHLIAARANAKASE